MEEIKSTYSFKYVEAYICDYMKNKAAVQVTILKCEISTTVKVCGNQYNCYREKYKYYGF